MSKIDYEVESAKRMNWMDLTGGTAKDGMTMLDYFAGKAIDAALKRMMHNFDVEMPDEEWTLDDHDLEMVAILAYRLAGYMLAERGKRFTPQGTIKGVTGKTYG